MTLTKILIDSNTVGSNLKRLRKQRGMTQENMAAKMQLLGSNISRETLSKIENGRNIKVADLLIAKTIFNTTPEELIPDTIINGDDYQQL